MEVLPLGLFYPDGQAASGLAPPKELVPVGRVVQCQQHNLVLLPLPLRLLRYFHLALGRPLVIAPLSSWTSSTPLRFIFFPSNAKGQEGVEG
jgi:hypothetical protein